MSRYICPNCGNVYEDLDERFKFCGGCGTPINSNSPVDDDEDEGIDFICYSDRLDLELIIYSVKEEFDLEGKIDGNDISILGGYFEIEDDGSYSLYDADDIYLMNVSLDDKLSEFEILDDIDELGIFDEDLDDEDSDDEDSDDEFEDETLEESNSDNEYEERLEDDEWADNEENIAITVNENNYVSPKIYEVIIESYDSNNKVSIINLVRKNNDISIIDAKHMIDNPPCVAAGFETEEQANSFEKQLREVSCVTRVKKNNLIEEFFNENIENESISNLLSDAHIDEMVDKYSKMVLDNSDSQINDLYFSKHPHLLTEEQKLILPIDKFKANLEKYKQRINETVEEYDSFLNQASLNIKKFLYIKDKKSLKMFRLISFISALIVLICSSLLFLLLFDGYNKFFNKEWIKFVKEATNYKILNIALCVICAIGIVYGLVRIIGNLISGHNKKVSLILKSKDFESFIDNKRKMIYGEEEE